MACFRPGLFVVDPWYQGYHLAGFKYHFACNYVVRSLCRDELSGMGRFVAAVKKRDKRKVETFLGLMMCLRFARGN